MISRLHEQQEHTSVPMMLKGPYVMRTRLAFSLLLIGGSSSVLNGIISFMGIDPNNAPSCLFSVDDLSVFLSHDTQFCMLTNQMAQPGRLRESGMLPSLQL
jgi:hypothetical protein